MYYESLGKLLFFFRFNYILTELDYAILLTLVLVKTYEKNTKQKCAVFVLEFLKIIRNGIRYNLCTLLYY